LKGGAQIELEDEQLSEPPSKCISESRVGLFLIREKSKFGVVTLTIGTGILANLLELADAKEEGIEADEVRVSGKIGRVLRGRIL